MTKPSPSFLAKVARGEVRRVRGYTARKGGYERFLGGEKQWERHYLAGYVTRPDPPQLGLPGVVRLTDAGAIAIEAATAGETAKTGSTRSAKARAVGIARKGSQ